jgi:NAD(P)H-dependent flavin oxidoreductase YrpB (nitropropane dioxygenase family)
MWPDRRLIDIFEIKHPLVLAPMSGFGTVELAASVCEAGGLGSISCATMQPEFAATIIQELRGLTSKPLNVNFFCHARRRRMRAASTLGINGFRLIVVNLGSTPSHRRLAWISYRSTRPCARWSRTPCPRW